MSAKPRNRNLRGILIMLVAVGLFSLMDGGMKLLSQHYPPFQVAALRGAASLPFALIWVARTVGLRSMLRVRWGLHLLRGLLSITMLGAFAYSLRTLPMSTAYTLFFVAPLIITALSVPVLGERVERGRWIAILLGLVGTIIALHPSTDGVLSIASLAVLFAAAGYAVSAITVRLLMRTDSSQSMLFWFLTMLTFGAGALAAPGWVSIAAGDAWIILGVGVFGALGQYALTEAFTLGEASVLAPFEYSALAWGIALDLLLWGTLPDRIAMLGAAIIIASGVYLVRQERGQEAAPQ